VRARALRDLCVAAAVIACGCAVQPSRSYYDDLDGGEDAGQRKVVGGGDGSVPDDSGGTNDDGPVANGDAGEDVAAEAAPVVESGITDSAPDTADEGVEASAGGPDAMPEAGPDAPPPIEAGCGPTNTTSNCGACGVACGNERVSTASCTGTACAYVCQTGYSNCSQTAPNTAGCECATPTCCNNSCETIHNSGYLNGFYYDCQPTVTASSSMMTLENQAIEACSQALGTTCHGGFGCGTTGPFHYACNGNPTSGAGCTNCWSYAGSDVLHAEDCGCPPTTLGMWN
jgi:hypothetical protein